MRGALAIIVLLAASCGPRTTYSRAADGAVSEKTLTDSIYRISDPDFRVVCWVYGGGYGKGISCLPTPEPR